MTRDDWQRPAEPEDDEPRWARAVGATARAVGVDRLARRYVLPCVAAAAPRPQPLTWEQQARAEFKRGLKPLLASDEPIVVGPWMSELGFEILYWIPLLRWFVEQFEIDPGRVTVVSRGGVGAWYEGLCGSYVETFDAVPPLEFRRLVEQRWEDLGGQKQVALGPWDEAILDLAGPEDWRSSCIFHPSLMYRLFRRVWRESISIEHVFQHTIHRRLAPPAESIPELPTSFVAVKFYFRDSFVDSHENRLLAQHVIESLAADRDVVLLNTGIEFDEHVELEPKTSARLVRPLESVPPETNLAVQSAIISRADAFVGTYGGLSYVASYYGVPSFSFYSHANFLQMHLHVAQRVAAALDSPFAVLDRRALEALSMIPSYATDGARPDVIVPGARPRT